MKTSLFWLAAVAVLFCASPAKAQQTIFNVPSGDVLDKGKVYVEGDLYERNWDAGSGKGGSAYLRGVTGLGHGIEAGINAGPKDLHAGKTGFIDAAVKARLLSGETIYGKVLPWTLTAGGSGGVGVQGANRKSKRYLGYTAAYVKVGGLRLGAGGYSATQRYFSAKTQSGGLATFEYSLPLPGLTLAGDWYTGEGGYLSPGLIYVNGRLTVYAAYGLSNDDRDFDLPTLEMGWTF